MRGERPEYDTDWKIRMEYLKDQRTAVVVSVNPATQAIEVDTNAPDATLLMGLLQQAQWVVMEAHRMPVGGNGCH